MMTRLASLIGLVLMTSAAHADPDPVAITGSAPLPAPSIYVGANTFAGIVPGAVIVLGASIDSGQHLTGALWAHEEFGTGTGSEFLGPSNTFVTGRVGLEGRACVHQGWICVAGGIDAAVDHYNWNEMTTLSTDQAMIIPRLALELGNERFHLRPALELPLGDGVGLQAKLGATVQW